MRASFVDSFPLVVNLELIKVFLDKVKETTVQVYYFSISFLSWPIFSLRSKQYSVTRKPQGVGAFQIVYPFLSSLFLILIL